MRINILKRINLVRMSKRNLIIYSLLLAAVADKRLGGFVDNVTRQPSGYFLLLRRQKALGHRREHLVMPTGEV